MPGIDGGTLRQWRRDRGWDVPQLARQLRRAASEPVAAHDGLVRMIRSWERGAHALSERYELLYRALGFGPEPEPGSGPELESRPDTVEVCCRTQDGRIAFVTVPLRQLADAVAAPPAPVPPAPAPPAPVPPAPVLAAVVPRSRPAPDAADSGSRPGERFLAARRALRDNDNLFGPRDVIPLAMRQLAAMRDASKELRGRDRHELLLPQIQFADLLGWLYQDSRDHDSAAHWLDRALDWAHALGDDGCVAFILARKSQLACDMRDPVTAIAAAGAAMRLTAGREHLTDAAAAAYGAHGHALAGDAAVARRLHDRARAALLAADGEPAQWATFMDLAYIDVYEAHSLAALGDHAAAADAFSAAIRELRPGYHRDRGVYLACEARARAAIGEHDHAASLASQALLIGTETGSARIFAELATVATVATVEGCACLAATTNGG